MTDPCVKTSNVMPFPKLHRQTKYLSDWMIEMSVEMGKAAELLRKEGIVQVPDSMDRIANMLTVASIQCDEQGL